MRRRVVLFRSTSSVKLPKLGYSGGSAVRASQPPFA